ncbi:MAG: hypothetical protein ACK421_04230 [Pseudanabaenaceae cyanobacterium]
MNATPEKRYCLIVDRQLISQAGFPPPWGWQSKKVTVYDIQPNQKGEIVATNSQRIVLSPGQGGSE